MYGKRRWGELEGEKNLVEGSLTCHAALCLVLLIMKMLVIESPRIRLMK